MKFRDEILQRKLIFREEKFQGILLDPLEQVYGPMTGDVVRNLDHPDLLVFHRR